MTLKLKIETEQEVDGRWIAVIDPIGALAYGATRSAAVQKAKAIALEVVADRLARGESPRTGQKLRRSAQFAGLQFVA